MAGLGVGIEGGPGAGHEGEVGAGFEAGVEAGSQARMEEVDGELLGIPALGRQQGRRTCLEFGDPRRTGWGFAVNGPPPRLSDMGAADAYVAPLIGPCCSRKEGRMPNHAYQHLFALERNPLFPST